MMPLATINPHSTMFLVFALAACGFAVAVLATSNVVRMAFYLTLSLGATSGLFFLAGAEFVGAMQLLIYVGGTLVLLIFGVMLTAQARFISMQTTAGDWILGGMVGGSLLLLLLSVAFSVKDWSGGLSQADQAEVAMVDSKTTTPIGLALTSVRVDKLDQTDEVLRKGMSGYLLPFVIISMHLLVVLIGAGYMARTKRRGAGGVLERAVSARPRDRKLGFFIAVGMIKGMIINFLLAVLCFALALLPAKGAPADNAGALTTAWHWLSNLVSTSPDWLLPLLGLAFLVNVLLLVVLYNWQSWAVLGLIAVPVFQAIALAKANWNAEVSDAGIAAVYLILALAPVIVLIGLMTKGKPPTVWSQMD
jgi:NADH:ubiquinone oxidoreductase subunit 6 (subunit J)